MKTNFVRTKSAAETQHNTSHVTSRGCLGQLQRVPVGSRNGLVTALFSYTPCSRGLAGRVASRAYARLKDMGSLHASRVAFILAIEAYSRRVYFSAPSALEGLCIYSVEHTFVITYPVHTVSLDIT